MIYRGHRLIAALIGKFCQRQIRQSSGCSAGRRGKLCLSSYGKFSRRTAAVVESDLRAVYDFLIVPAHTGFFYHQLDFTGSHRIELRVFYFSRVGPGSFRDRIRTVAAVFPRGVNLVLKDPSVRLADPRQITQGIKSLFSVQIKFNINIIFRNVFPAGAPESIVISIQHILGRERRIASAVPRPLAVGRGVHAFPGNIFYLPNRVHLEGGQAFFIDTVTGVHTRLVFISADLKTVAAVQGNASSGFRELIIRNSKILRADGTDIHRLSGKGIARHRNIGMYRLFRIVHRCLRVGMDLGRRAVYECVVFDGHIPDQPGLKPASGVVLQQDRSHPLLLERVALDHHFSSGGAENASGGHILRQIVLYGDIRSIGNIFHRVIILLNTRRQRILQGQFNVRIIEPGITFHRVSLIGNQRAAVDKFNLISRLKGLESPGLAVHKANFDLLLRFIDLHDPQMGAVDVEGVIVAAAEMAVGNHHISPAPGDLYKVRETGHGSSGLLSGRALQPGKGQIFRILSHDSQTVHVVEAAVLQGHIFASVDKGSHLVSDAVPDLIGAALPVAGTSGEGELQHVVSQICNAAAVAVHADPAQGLIERIILLH